MLTPDQLTAYFARIGLAAPLTPDLTTLHMIHAAHCAAIPFENIDVQLGLVPSREPQAVYAKLVVARRGGWCHEQNTLLGQVLAAIGFHVQRLSAGVARPDNIVPSMGSHLSLKVMVDERPWLVDVGFGSWVGAPLPLEPGHWPLVPWPVSLSRDTEANWRLTAELGTHAMHYLFADRPGDEALMAETCLWQSRDPASPFVQNLVVQRRKDGCDWTLRGRVLTETTSAGSRQRLLADRSELVRVLGDRFGLDVPEVATLWPAIVERHDTLFQTPAPPTT